MTEIRLLYTLIYSQKDKSSETYLIGKQYVIHSSMQTGMKIRANSVVTLKEF